MKTRINVIVIILSVILILFGTCSSADSSRGYIPINLYYTGTNVGNHTSQSGTLNAASTYYFKENSHSGSFSYLNVNINNVFIGNFSSAAMSGNGYPVSYDPNYGPAHIQMYLGYTTGVSAAFTGQAYY